MYKVQNNVPLVPHHVHPAEPSAHWETTSPRVHTQPSHTPHRAVSHHTAVSHHRAVSQHTDTTHNRLTPCRTLSHPTELSHNKDTTHNRLTPHRTVSHTKRCHSKSLPWRISLLPPVRPWEPAHAVRLLLRGRERDSERDGRRNTQERR